MSATQQELVQTTFAKLAVMPEVAGALFHECHDELAGEMKAAAGI